MSEDIKVFREQEDKTFKESAATELTNALPLVRKLVNDPEFVANANSATEYEFTSTELNAKIDELLKSPEIDAMLENVAADAADDAKYSQGIVNSQLPTYLTKSGGSDYLQVLRNDFEEFKKKVTAAFKHAGFKF